MPNKLIQWLLLRRNKEINIETLESCPACRSQANYHDMLLKNAWWRRVLGMSRHKPVRIECAACSVMIDCSGLRKEYAFLLWNRRVEIPESNAARVNSLVVQRDSLRSTVAQLQASLDAATADYERRNKDAIELEIELSKSRELLSRRPQ